MKRTLFLVLGAVIAVGCAKNREVATLTDPSACPVALRGAMVDVYDTERGVAITFTADERAQVSELRELAAGLAMEFTGRHDPVPHMEQFTTQTLVRVPGGSDAVVTPPGDLGAFVEESELRVLDKSYAQVVGIPSGVTVVLEPRQGDDVANLRRIGTNFRDRLVERCGTEIVG